MKRFFTTISVVFMLLVVQTNSQTVYSGTIGKAVVEFTIDDVCHDSQGVEAVYFYEKYKDPIALEGIYYQKTLHLNENGKGEIAFYNFDEKNDSVSGTWTNLFNKKKSAIVLMKKYDFNIYDTKENNWQRELLQRASLENYYFKIIVTSNGGVNGILVLEKKTGKQFQKIADIDCNSLGLRSIEVEDDNVDGIVDFQIHEGGTRETLEDGQSGPYVDMWLTFLFDPVKKLFVESGIEYK